MSIINRFATEDYIENKFPDMQLGVECAVPEKFMGKRVYQAYFKLNTFPSKGQVSYINSDIFNSIDTVLELFGTVDKAGLLCGTFSYGGKTLSIGYDKQQYNGTPIRIFVNNEMDSTYFDANTSAIIKIKYTKI